MSLNKLLKEMMGKPMTKKEKKLLEKLRRLVKEGKITVKQGHEIWDREVLGK